MSPSYSFKAKLWKWSGESAWYFVTLPIEYSEEIKMITGSETRRGFGSVRVSVNIANENWNTSIFPDNKTKSYLLPVKKKIRESLDLGNGDTIDLTITLVDM